MSDIRDSGSIEQDADIVIMLYRADYYSDSGKNKEGEEQQVGFEVNNPISPVEAYVRKNRNGGTGCVKFIFDKPISTFDAAADDQQEQFQR